MGRIVSDDLPFSARLIITGFASNTLGLRLCCNTPRLATNADLEAERSTPTVIRPYSMRLINSLTIHDAMSPLPRPSLRERVSSLATFG